jgi:opacity protein-like surface antigen
MRAMKLSKKLLIAALLLTSAASAAAAQSLPSYGGCYGLKARGYYGTPYNGGPQYGSGGGDQYGYGPAYSYARQAPDCLSPEPSGVGTRRSRTAHGK